MLKKKTTLHVFFVWGRCYSEKKNPISFEDFVMLKPLDPLWNLQYIYNTYGFFLGGIENTIEDLAKLLTLKAAQQLLEPT